MKSPPSLESSWDLGLLDEFYFFQHPSNQGNSVCLYFASRYWTNSLYLSSDPSDSGPYYSRRPGHFRSRCLSTHLGPSTPHRDRDWLCHYLSTLRMDSQVRPTMVSEDLWTNIGWLMKASGSIAFFFIFMMIRAG